MSVVRSFLLHKLHQNKPICSNQFFQKHIEQNGSYPSTVEWADNFTSFQPLACEIVPADIPNCLQKSRIRSIGVMGASQGRHYAVSVLAKIREAGIPCVTLEYEHRINSKPDLKYFARGNKTLLNNVVAGDSQNCRNCNSFRSECQLQGQLPFRRQRTLQIEYISTTKLPAQQGMARGSNKMNYEKIIFDYLENHFPDLNLFFIPMNHIKQSDSTAKFQSQFKHFLSKIKKRKTRRSEVYLIPGTAEFESARPPKSIYTNKRYFGHLASDRIRVLNKNMFSMLQKDILEPNSKIHSFLDLVDVTSALETLSRDGVHFQQKWYDVFIEAVLGVHCQN
ncbi:hypothetical protein CAPTEDRAFT_210510 [Capitella teleta]|uniref:SGNH domain-containing protein n=1 Tax=Capitella teleta TaxID=283909 RepID=R7VF36_CAPTE|nr:hypothetical protein CAPTEDRAFT_210510 [Capitella teleta]|eukprot:ELU17219.1 hypothetical protein CAPTEDRAFT_210510 [Capitella teleta]